MLESRVNKRIIQALQPGGRGLRVKEGVEGSETLTCELLTKFTV